MLSWRNARRQAGLLLIGLGAWAPAARAQAWTSSGTHVEIPPVEVSFALSIHSLGTDVNAAPDCATFNAPCSHTKPSTFGGFGLVGSVARNVTEQVAVAGEVAVHASPWDSWQSLQAHRRDSNTVGTILAGPKISTAFSSPHRKRDEPARFFAQVLVGIEASGVLPVRPAVQLGGGVDFIARPHGIQQSSHDFTVRMEIDYCRTPGNGRNFSGWRSLIGIVFGPATQR
jgi:hypothetical protein